MEQSQRVTYKAAAPRGMATNLGDASEDEYETDSDGPELWHNLPGWACDGAVMEYAQWAEGKGKACVEMRKCVGPAVKYTWYAVLIMWPGYMLLTMVAYLTSTCSENGLVTTPWWLWILFLPVVLLRIRLEFKCLANAAIPYSQAIGSEFRILGWRVCFEVFVFVGLVHSFLNIADFATDSFFTAAVLRQEQCTNEQVTKIWHKVLQQSCFYWLPEHDFAWEMLAMYLLTFLQLLYPMFMVQPACAELLDLNFEVGGGDYENEDTPESQFEYKTAMHGAINLGDVLYTLGEATGMGTLLHHQPSYPRARAATTRLNPQLTPEEKAKKCLGYVVNAQRRGLSRIGFVGLFENSAQVNVQATIFAINRQITGGNYNVQALVSIALSIICNLVKIRETVELLQFSWEATRDIEDKFHNLDDYKSAKKNNRWLMLMVAGVVVFLGYAGCKIAHCFICDDYLWNVSGCVEISAESRG